MQTQSIGNSWQKNSRFPPLSHSSALLQWIRMQPIFPIITKSSHELESHSTLLKSWTRTALSTSQVDPFCCTPPWQLSFHDAFSPNRKLLIKESAYNLLLFAEHILPDAEVVLTPIEESWLFGSPLLGKLSEAALRNTADTRATGSRSDSASIHSSPLSSGCLVSEAVFTPPLYSFVQSVSTRSAHYHAGRYRSLPPQSAETSLSGCRRW